MKKGTLAPGFLAFGSLFSSRFFNLFRCSHLLTEIDQFLYDSVLSKTIHNLCLYSFYNHFIKKKTNFTVTAKRKKLLQQQDNALYYNNKTMREDRCAQMEELQREFPLLIKLKL